VLKSLRGWEFDELEEKSTATEKPNSYVFMFSDPYYTDTLRQHALKADISGFAPLHDIQKKTGIGFI